MFNSQPSSTLSSLPTQAPDALSPFRGYHRADGRVGTRNYWLVLPLFPGETQQLTLLKEALMTTLGYQGPNPYLPQLQSLREQFRAGSYFEAPQPAYTRPVPLPLFANINGVRFLPNMHQHTNATNTPDSFWQLLAGYCTHPNVGGITVLSMEGTNTRQLVDTLRQHIDRVNPAIGTPLIVADRFSYATEFDWMSAATCQTFQAMAALNKQTRRPAPLSSLTMGVRWGESGLSANPAVGYCVDLALELGATVLMAAPDAHSTTGQKTASLCAKARMAGSPRLQQLHFPGNPVEITTALVGAGCNLHLSTNWAGRPTGNPVAPVVELAARQATPDGLSDWIDIDCGPASPDTTIAQIARTILHYSLKLASGEQLTQSEARGLHDFRIYQA